MHDNRKELRQADIKCYPSPRVGGGGNGGGGNGGGEGSMHFAPATAAAAAAAAAGGSQHQPAQNFFSNNNDLLMVGGGGSTGGGSSGSSIGNTFSSCQQLPEFPGARDFASTSSISIPTEKLQTLITMYRAHCQRIMDSVNKFSFTEVLSSACVRGL